MKHIELFAGAGGLALGCKQAGFEPFIFNERDKYCARTLRSNNLLFGNGGPLISEKDIRDSKFDDLQTDIALLTGGVPCQPWSVGGVAKGFDDERNLWPEFIRVLGEILPDAFIAENVQGILRPKFRPYMSYLHKALVSPTVRRWPDEPWESHFNSVKYSGGNPRLHYDLAFLSLDAVNYGVPQYRKRLFIVGFRKDLGVSFKFPYRNWWNDGCDDRPHTLREALEGLPDPRSPEAEKFRHHEYIPGAREYRGHTANVLDAPAKTVKAGVHGMPGGEGIVELDLTNDFFQPIRYLTVRELARIQTFPDDYTFSGSRTQQVKQIGNAVPVKLAAYVAKSVYCHLEK